MLARPALAAGIGILRAPQPYALAAPRVGSSLHARNGPPRGHNLAGPLQRTPGAATDSGVASPWAR